MTTRQRRNGARYSTGAIILHWTIAALMIAQVALGWQMGGTSAKSFALFQLHKSIGIAILLLTVARIAWRLANRPPPMLAHGWEAWLARLIHRLFYVLLLGLPLSGWLLVSTSKITVPTLLFGIVPWPNIPGLGGLDDGVREALHDAGEAAHELMVFIFLIGVLLHVAGALKHHWIDRDGTIARMAPGVKGAFHPRLLLIFALLAGAFAFGRFFVPPLPQGESGVAIDQPPPSAAEFPAVTPIDNAVDQLLTEEKEAEEAAAADPDALARWVVQPGGTLGFETQWSGSALNGHFRSWDADISFGRNALDQSRVTVRIQTGSITTGQGQPDDALPGDDWFAVRSFPTATFNASKFRRAGNGFEATGTLMIKGQTRPITLPFTLDITGDTARMRGSVTIDRIAYGIGWPTVDDVPAEVTVKIDLTAKRAE
jgi:cytochrome b561/polyisoprenoid-binding protein YceI